MEDNKVDPLLRDFVLPGIETEMGVIHNFGIDLYYLIRGMFAGEEHHHTWCIFAKMDNLVYHNDFRNWNKKNTYCTSMDPQLLEGLWTAVETA